VKCFAYFTFIIYFYLTYATAIYILILAVLG